MVVVPHSQRFLSLAVHDILWQRQHMPVRKAGIEPASMPALHGLATGSVIGSGKHFHPVKVLPTQKEIAAGYLDASDGG